MLISDILKSKSDFIFSANENEKICTVLEVFREKMIGSCMVKDDSGKLVGIMTEKDVTKCFKGFDNFKEIKIKDIMTKYEDLIIASTDDDIQYAMDIMTQKRIKHLPIYKDNELYGILSIGDIVKAQLQHSNHIAKTYLDHILGKTPQPNNEEY